MCKTVDPICYIFAGHFLLEGRKTFKIFWLPWGYWVLVFFSKYQSRIFWNFAWKSGTFGKSHMQLYFWKSTEYFLDFWWHRAKEQIDLEWGLNRINAKFHFSKLCLSPAKSCKNPHDRKRPRSPKYGGPRLYYESRLFMMSNG